MSSGQGFQKTRRKQCRTYYSYLGIITNISLILQMPGSRIQESRVSGIQNNVMFENYANFKNYLFINKYFLSKFHLYLPSERCYANLWQNLSNEANTIRLTEVIKI